MRYRSLKPSARAYAARQTAAFQKACERPEQPKVEILMEYKGVKVIVTDHVRHRAAERHGMDVEKMKVYFEHVINGIQDSGWEPVEYNQEVFVYSKIFQRGCVIALRRDFKSSSKDLAMVLVTMYPYGKALPLQKDTEVIYV